MNANVQRYMLVDQPASQTFTLHDTEAIAKCLFMLLKNDLGLIQSLSYPTDKQTCASNTVKMLIQHIATCCIGCTQTELRAACARPNFFNSLFS